MSSDATQILLNAAAAAVMAPSNYNTQPWRFRIVGGATLEILADITRHLAVIDHDRRQLVQSCGCALWNARVAVRAMGLSDEVTTMPADGAHRGVLATLRLGPPREPSAADRALMRALPLRRTNRRPFLSRPVADVEPLLDAAARAGAWAVRLDAEHKRRLGVLIDRADQLQYADPAFRAELARWLTPLASRRRDGIPFVEKEYGSALPFSVMRALRSPSLGSELGKTEQELVAGSPVVVVLGTEGDDLAAWLASGQALEALLLEATARELSAAFLNQALEVPEVRGLIGDLVGRAGYPQMVLRLGYPSMPFHHAAPRRDLEDVIEIVA
jgi:hypothetical protein